MAVKAKCYIKRNNLPRLMRQMTKEIEVRTDMLANTGAALIESDLRNGRRHGGTRRLFNDTGASASSIYRIRHDGDSNYGEKVAEFESKAGVNYGGRSLEQIVFPEWQLHSEAGQIKSAFASLSLIMAFWEYGHHNVFTKRYETAPILSWTAFVLWQRMKSHYTNLLSPMS